MRLSGTFAATLIIRLRGAICPTTIFRRVRSIVVNPIQRESLRASSHVFKEPTEVVNPLFTHRYSATTIVGVADAGGLIASILGASPRSILSRVFKAMLEESRSRYFHLVARATSNKSVDEVATRYRMCSPAVALAVPVQVAVLSSCWIKGSQTSEDFAGKIIEFEVSKVFPVAAATQSRATVKVAAGYDFLTTAIASTVPITIPGNREYRRNNCESSESFSGEVCKLTARFAKFFFSHGALRGAAVRAALGADYIGAARLV